MPAFLCADDMKKGLRPRRSVRSAMQHEVMFYALAQVFTLSHIHH